MKKIYIFTLLVFILAGCLPAPSDKGVESKNVGDNPSLEIELKNGLPTLNIKNGIKHAQDFFSTSNVEIKEIQILEDPPPKSNQVKGWIALNRDGAICRPTLPEKIQYGMALPSCMRIERNDLYDKSKTYLFLIIGTADGRAFEFSINGAVK